ncbi:hypothetical protein DFH28DRAFT_1135433 [Melampsora americana]|nr:hypothetical protein DFH28DRAFT_1135433 [Melampsora americana]
MTVPTPAGNSDNTNGDETDGSIGSVILSPGEKNLRTLMNRFKKDFKSGENVTSVTNPKDPLKILLLNTSRIRDWANDWADGIPGVDEVNPPMTVGNSAGAANGTVIHQNYYGAPFPSAPPPYPGLPATSAVPPAPTGHLPSTRLSPPLATLRLLKISCFSRVFALICRKLVKPYPMKVSKTSSAYWIMQLTLWQPFEAWESLLLRRKIYGRRSPNFSTTFGPLV